MTTVLLSGRRFSLEDLQSEPSTFTHWFEKARAENGAATCLCKPPGLRLQIRRRDGLYHLAGWPLDGDAHRGSCFFYKTPKQWTGRSAYAPGAIVDRNDGSADIKTAMPLKVRVDDRAAGQPSVPSEGGEGARRKAVGALGLLHELWESAALNRWSEGWSRSWSRCWWHLRQVDRRINGVPANECLHVVHPWEPARKEQIEAEFSAFRNRFGVRREYRHRQWVIGELKQYSPTQYGFRIELRQQRVPYFASKELIASVEKSARAVTAARENPDSRTIVIMLVDQTSSGNLQVIDMALMLTTKTYIPCESSYELQMSDALAAAGRSFIKPLRYDGVAETFPDFRLLDTEPQTVVEVYGMIGNPAYDRRKAEKQASYRASRTPVIEWDTRRPIPDLRLATASSHRDQ